MSADTLVKVIRTFDDEVLVVQRLRRQSCPVVTHFVTQARFDPLLDIQQVLSDPYGLAGTAIEEGDGGATVSRRRPTGP